MNEETNYGIICQYNILVSKVLEFFELIIYASIVETKYTLKWN